jgi:hypothetical protein
MRIPTPILVLFRRVTGTYRDEATSAKSRMMGIIDKDRRAAEAILRQLTSSPVVTGEVFTSEITGEADVKIAHPMIEEGPPDDPVWGLYTLTHGPTCGQTRHAVRIPEDPEDDPTLDRWIVIELQDSDHWYRSIFPNEVQTGEGIRKGKYLCIRAPIGDGPGRWRIGGVR